MHVVHYQCEVHRWSRNQTHLSKNSWSYPCVLLSYGGGSSSEMESAMAQNAGQAFHTPSQRCTR